MASRLYVTSRSIGERVTGAPQGNWSAGDSSRDNRGRQRFFFLLAQTATDGGVVTFDIAGASITKANNQKIIAANMTGGAVWMTDKLGAQVTLNGTLAVTLKVSCTFAASLGTAAYHVYAYIARGASLTPVAVLINNVTDATAWTTTLTWRTATFNLSGAVAEIGDRIVVEIGANCSPPTAPAGDNAYTLSWGTTNTSDVVQADAVNGATGAAAAWVEFSNTLSFAAAPSPPANDACADAIVIPPTSLPYTSAEIDTTTSADTGRSVWFTWTPAVSQRVFFNTLGGNFYTRLRAWTGTCGGLSAAAGGDNSDTKIPWVGTSQSAIWLDVVAGTQYFFQIDSNRQTIGANAQFAARNSGGACVFRMFPYSAPIDGDLFVNCQHIVAYRAGLPVNIQSGFYNQTPTNSCIDYTLRPLDDINGGISTALRLMVDLFGSSPLVEILDLLTLNVGEFEIDYFDDVINYVNNSENPSSIVMDAAGRLLIGYFGDNYSVIGSLSTPDQCRVNRFDGTHAQNQAGAPWPDAEAFTVAQDVGGSDYIELSKNMDVLYYTSAGREVKRFNVSTNLQMADFATLPVQPSSVPRPGARGVRLLYPYDGTGGCLVAYGTTVLRLNAAGTIVQSYTPSASERAQDLDKLELAPDANSFWVSDQYSCSLFQFNLHSGVELSSFETDLPPGQLCGFTIFGYRGTPFLPPDFETEVREIRRIRQAPHLSDEQRQMRYNRFWLDVMTGVGRITGQGVNPIVNLSWSDDGGKTWSDDIPMSAGQLGAYKTRVMWRRLGRSRDRVFRVQMSDPVSWVLLDAFVSIEPGTN